MQTKTIISALVVLAIIALFVAYSWSSEKKPATSEAIKIGLILPVTGDVAVYGEAAHNAALLAESDLKARGINITPIIEDDQLDNKLAVSAAKKLLEVDKVAAVIGFSSGETLSVCPITRAAKAVFLTTASSPLVSDCGGYTFRNYPSDVNQGRVLAEKASAVGYRRVFVAYINNDYGNGLQKEFVKNYQGTVASEAFAVKEKDFRSLLTKMKQVSPDAVILISYVAEGTQLLVQMHELGIKAPVIASESMKDDSVIAPLPKEVAARLTAVAAADYQGKEATAFKAAYEARFQKKPAVFADYVYDNVIVVAEALKKCTVTPTDPKSACVAAYLHQLRTVGATGNIQFDERGDVMNKPYDLFRIKGSTFLPIH